MHGQSGCVSKAQRCFDYSTQRGKAAPSSAQEAITPLYLFIANSCLLLHINVLNPVYRTINSHSSQEHIQLQQNIVFSKKSYETPTVRCLPNTKQRRDNFHIDVVEYLAVSQRDIYIKQLVEAAHILKALCEKSDM